MGVDLHTAKLLMLAKREGVEFSRTLTLGHQWLHVDLADLRSLQREMDLDLGLDKRAEVLEHLPYADGLLKAMGADSVTSVDASAYEDATVIHDMNTEIPDSMEESYSLVADFGTLEHVFNFPVAIQSCMRMVRVGGHLLVVTPANNLMGHGFYQFSPELFYRVLAPDRGFRIKRLFVSEVRRCAAWYEVPDPSSVRQRAELTNAMPTYLLLIAEKISSTPRASPTPQQSDYENLSWTGKRSVIQRTPDGRDASLRAVVPDWLRAVRSILLARFRPSYGGRCFRRVSKSLRRA
jgi:SAM-dependent methyltransferase